VDKPGSEETPGDSSFCWLCVFAQFAIVSAMYRNLDPQRIVETTQTLSNRVSERFPDSGLSRVAGELSAVSREATAMSQWLAKPHRPIRIAVGVCIVLILMVLLAAVLSLDTKVTFSSSVADFIQGLDAAVNEIVLLGVAIFFLVTIENRFKRRRALRAIHVLRSIAHIIDMHQLTKDPERIVGNGPDTRSSPKRTMTPFELTRYLDYCSEMLALISKVGAVYVQNFNDPVTLSAVNDVEDLTAGLSRKIWQKIVILDRIIAPDNRAALLSVTTREVKSGEPKLESNG